MTTTRLRTTALCNDCGEPRPAAWYERDQRCLRCDACEAITTHSLIAPRGVSDWRETENRHAAGPLHDVAQLEATMSRMGVWVWDCPAAQGGNVEVRRYLDPLDRPDGRRVRWLVAINPNLSQKDRAAALRWAWLNLLPSATWDECSPLTDTSGKVHVGLHRVLSGGAR